MSVAIFSHPKTTEYHLPGHPEAPFRVSETARFLTEKGYAILEPDAWAQPADVFMVHSPLHWASVQNGEFDDPDTPFYPQIAEIALISLSGALSALDRAQNGEPAFSLMRPPGHHAGENRISGFCYVNNVAVACARALKANARVALLDIDVHHGDGSQEFALGKPGMLFASLHQNPLYPGTGLKNEENCLNYGLAPGTTPEAYLATLDEALKQIQQFKPDLIAVSAGFDTFKKCPLANLKLEAQTYREIALRIAALNRPRFAVLEGGYAEEMPLLVERFLSGWG